MARPGIMLYFDILEPIRMLSDEDKGRLLVAMLEYGRDGVVPKLDGSLGIVWSFVYPLIDKDGQRYDDMKLQREYAAFCKKRKRIWMPKILFDDWVVMTDDERQRAVDPVLSRNPTTTNNDNVQLTTYNLQRTTYNDNVQLQQSTSNYNQQPHNDDADDAATAYREMKYFKGELGKGVVILSDEQVDRLLETLGLDAFDHYVSKLANFIIKNGATVKSHFDTILKWWREDSCVDER